jgi:hypothetical protein
MTMPKVWMKTTFPGLAELCDRQRMKVVSEGGGPRGEWHVKMQSTRFSLLIGEDLGVSGYFPSISIKVVRGRKGWGRLDEVLQSLGLWEHHISHLSERELAKALEAHLDVVLEYLENGPA